MAVLSGPIFRSERMRNWLLRAAVSASLQILMPLPQMIPKILLSSSQFSAASFNLRILALVFASILGKWLALNSEKLIPYLQVK